MFDNTIGIGGTEPYKFESSFKIGEITCNENGDILKQINPAIAQCVIPADVMEKAVRIAMKKILKENNNA